MIRVNLESRQLIDVRAVQQSPTTPFSQDALYVRDDVSRTAVFSPDGRYIYVTQFAAFSRRYLTAIAVDTARVVSTQFSGQDVRGVGVCEDNERLYALVADAQYADVGPARLVLVNARTLQELARSAPFATSARDIAAVVRR